MTTARRTYMDTYRKEQKQAGYKRVNVTLTPAEYGRMVTSAKAQGERLTTHLKTLAFAYLDKTYLVPPDQGEALDRLLAVVRGIGNNLNQLARHSNEMRYFMETGEVQLQLKRLDEAVREFVKEPSEADTKKTPTAGTP